MNFLLPLLVATLVGVFPVWAQDTAPQTANAEELFAQGTQLYQNQRYVEASDKFKDLASRHSSHAAIFFNWGLSEYQAGRRGLGVALWRRALTLRPGYRPPREALTVATRQMQLREFDDSQLLERVRHTILVRFSLDQLLGATCVLLAASGWLLLTYVGRRRRALNTEQPLPPFPWIGGALTFLFLILASVSLLKGYEQTVPRATAVTVTAVRSAPSDASSILFELREGADVILRQAKKGWTQIRYPGGMSGWVPNEALFQTSGMQL